VGVTVEEVGTEVRRVVGYSDMIRMNCKKIKEQRGLWSMGFIATIHPRS
jgi:hypothetical protein